MWFPTTSEANEIHFPYLQAPEFIIITFRKNIIYYCPKPYKKAIYIPKQKPTVASAKAANNNKNEPKYKNDEGLAREHTHTHSHTQTDTSDIRDT